MERWLTGAKGFRWLPEKKKSIGYWKKVTTHYYVNAHYEPRKKTTFSHMSAIFQFARVCFRQKDRGRRRGRKTAFAASVLQYEHTHTHYLSVYNNNTKIPRSSDRSHHHSVIYCQHDAASEVLPCVGKQFSIEQMLPACHSMEQETWGTVCVCVSPRRRCVHVQWHSKFMTQNYSVGLGIPEVMRMRPPWRLFCQTRRAAVNGGII